MTSAKSTSRNRTRRLTIGALMGAVAFVLMFFSFSIPILSPFAKLDFSALPELIGGFILGPLGALEIIGVKILLILVTKGTTTMFIGELSKFMISSAFVLPAAFYYRKNRTRKGAIVGMCIGTLVGLAVAILTNLFMIYPMYIYFYGMNWDAIITTCNKINPLITNKLTLVLLSFLPFNLISFTSTALMTELLYKKISVPLKKLIA